MCFTKTPGLLWTPIRTKPRREKKLAEYCLANDVEHYLPLKRTLHRYGRRTFEFMVPMFPGYIFCKLDEPTYRSVLNSHSILFRIDVQPESEDSLIEELSVIKSMELLSKDAEIVVNPEIVAGRRIKICTGPLKGVSGFVESRKGKLIASVNVEILGHSVSMEMDAGDLEPEE